MHHPTDRITCTTAYVTPVVEHWLEQEITGYADNMLIYKTTNTAIKKTRRKI